MFNAPKVVVATSAGLGKVSDVNECIQSGLYLAAKIVYVLIWFLLQYFLFFRIIWFASYFFTKRESLKIDLTYRTKYVAITVRFFNYFFPAQVWN